MKTIVALIIAVTVSVFTFGQVTEMEYDSLDQASQELFDYYGNLHDYGTQNLTQNDSVLAVYKINNIPDSRKTVTDSLGVERPECPTQYMIVYAYQGKKLAYVTIQEPASTASASGVSISTYLSQTGYKQGDGEFGHSNTTPANSNSGHLIHEDW